jgi:hypothetical protein
MLFFAKGKFYTIFSFLFGLGFSVKLARAEAKGRDVPCISNRKLPRKSPQASPGPGDACFLILGQAVVMEAFKTKTAYNGNSSITVARIGSVCLAHLF